MATKPVKQTPKTLLSLLVHQAELPVSYQDYSLRGNWSAGSHLKTRYSLWDIKNNITICGGSVRFELTPHQHIPRNTKGQDWLCGDLHGQYEALQRALSEVGFNSALDRLFLLGDVIDRGPKSRELLNWVLSTDYVHCLMGNHELVFAASSFNVRYRDKHRAIGGEWVDHIDFSEYRKLTTRCIQKLPLTITLACQNGSLGLVHAQSPADTWQDVQQAVSTDRFAIDCTWPWNRAQGSDQAIAGVTAVVSGHIGTAEVVRKGNQVWIDTLEQTGKMTLVPVNDIFDWVRGYTSNG